MEKDEFLKLLPKLIREDDEVKGAIITALSGVMATKEDIQRIIEHSERRFEDVNKRFEDVNKRFEEARKERKDIKDSMIILREIVGELLQETVNIKHDIKRGNKEILDYLKQQFKEN
ncbi:MAG: hypothetical protein ACTSQJ_12105 [Promethearchaeota archaeon]